VVIFEVWKTVPGFPGVIFQVWKVVPGVLVAGLKV
jgi:hypothetical protein